MSEVELIRLSTPTPTQLRTASGLAGPDRSVGSPHAARNPVLTPLAGGGSFAVTLIGAGPGDPELLTIKAVKALRRATVALVDDLVDLGVLRYLKRSARIIHVGKRGGCASTPQAFIHKLMIQEAQRGERVVRIKGGDPFVFGRGGEECAALRDAGIEVEIISGLTAGIAGPATLGIPVTDRRFAPGVALVTGHAKEGGVGPDWQALARSGLTLVVYMGVARLAHIAQRLMDGGLGGDTPVALISTAHMPAQRQLFATLATVAAQSLAQGMASPAVLVVGDVVQAAPAWHEVASPGTLTIAA